MLRRGREGGASVIPAKAGIHPPPSPVFGGGLGWGFARESAHPSFLRRQESRPCLPPGGGEA